jgi:hypothetical protein
MSPLLRFLQTQTMFRSFSLEKMAIATDGSILVPLYTAAAPREGTPDGFAMVRKGADGGWEIGASFNNPEPQVL